MTRKNSSELCPSVWTHQWGARWSWSRAWWGSHPGPQSWGKCFHCFWRRAPPWLQAVHLRSRPTVTAVSAWQSAENRQLTLTSTHRVGCFLINAARGDRHSDQELVTLPTQELLSLAGVADSTGTVASIHSFYTDAVQYILYFMIMSEKKEYWTFSDLQQPTCLLHISVQRWMWKCVSLFTIVKDNSKRLLSLERTD